MKLYIASATANWPAVRHLQATAIRNGHEITMDWTKMVEEWNRDENRDNPEDTPPEVLTKAAIDDLNGVKDCELFVILCWEKMMGALVEFGMACGLDKPCWVVNHEVIRYNVFWALPNVRFLAGWEAVQEIEHSNGGQLCVA